MRTNMSYDLESASHAVYSLNYHLILVIKYRRDVFTSEKIIDELTYRTKNIAPNYGVALKNQEVDTDHLQIVFSAEPTTNLTKFVNALKTGTSKAIRHRFDIKDKLWEEGLWSDSYCLITTGEVTRAELKQYVERQGDEREG